MPFDLDPLATAWMAAALFVAAFVRGYSGFGFAALVVSAASLVTDPLHFVPVVIMADVFLTVRQARQIRPDIDWRRAGLLFAGCAIGVPLGVRGVAAIGPDMARALISLFILTMCAVLLRGWRFAHTPGAGPHGAVGVISGLANGAAVGGLPVAAFFAAQTIPAATFRATVVAYFTLMDLWTLPNMALSGLITRDTFLATLIAMPILLLGLAAGSRRFLHANPTEFRRFAILLLAVLSLFALWKALI